MAEETNHSQTYIILSSSDEEGEEKNAELKVETLNCLGLEKSSSVGKTKMSDSVTGSLSPASTVNGGNTNKDDFSEPNALIEKFVSTLYTVLKKKEDIQIIQKVYILKNKCQHKYLKSEEFKNRATSVIDNITKDPGNVFVYIKELYDEMKAYKTKKQENGNCALLPSQEEANEKHIRTLEKLLGKLDKKIRKLKKREISLEEMDSNYSAYVYEDRLQKRFIKVWEKLCELKKRSSKLKCHSNRKFQYNASRYPEVNSDIETFINNSRTMPDYVDILKVARSTNEKSSLGLPEPAVQLLAQEIFQDVCRELKHRRLCDFRELAGSYLTDDLDSQPDPADSDAALKEKLEISYKDGQVKEENLLADFTAKQVALKLEPEEVPDEAVEGDDPERCEDPDDEEEDRLIESQQIEDEEYSDDEKIKRFLDDPDATVDDDTKSPFMSSEDEPESDVICVVEGCEIEEAACIKAPSMTVLENPSSVAAKVDSELHSDTSLTSRTCMARLKVTPLKSSLVDQSKEIETSVLQDSEVDILTPPPPKRLCSQRNEVDSPILFEEDVIVLD